MKTKLLLCITVICLMLTSFSAVAISPSNENTLPEVNAVAAKADGREVLKARFLNMLNHSFSYGEDLCFTEAMVNNSVPALLDKCIGEDELYIAEEYVNDYLFNMYGITCEDFTEINKDFPRKDGFVYVIPRGFSIYNHTVDSVTLNEDGSYTVVTTLSIDSHDGAENAKAITLFVKNEGSAFGFNIISSDIIENVNEI